LKLAVTRFVIEDSRVKLIFIGEMSKNHRFGNARPLPYFFGRRSAETLFRKKPHRYVQNLPTPFVARHSRANRF
jgi:hypothetical protein